MGTTILALLLLVGVPSDPVNSAADTTRLPPLSTAAVSLSEYQTDQIVWWLYYGEWATASNLSENPEKKETPDGDGAATKKSQVSQEESK